MQDLARDKEDGTARVMAHGQDMEDLSAWDRNF